MVPEIMVTPADADSGGVVWSMAVTTTPNGVGMLGFVGGLKDAVYGPVETTTPEFPVGPLTCQVTGAVEFCTATENCSL